MRGGAIPPLLNTPTWHGAQLKNTGTTLLSHYIIRTSTLLTAVSNSAYISLICAKSKTNISNKRYSC